MSQEYETVLIVVTGELITIKAINAQGKHCVAEEYRRLANGELDCVSGNFEDEPSLPEGLAEALLCLPDSLLAVMEGLQRATEQELQGL